MNMKVKSNNLKLLFSLFMILFSAACSHDKRAEHAHGQHLTGEFACPMQCEGDKTYDKPGNCPVCKMKLVPVKQDIPVQTIPPNRQVLSRQKTIRPGFQDSNAPVKAYGYIIPSEDRNVAVASRTEGRIEKLYVRYNNQYVTKGEKIMDVYSPSLRKYQEEHLFLRQSNAGSSLLLQSAEKLKLLGMTGKQIEALEASGRINPVTPVYSTSSGYIFFQNAGVVSIPGKENADMDAMAMNNTQAGSTATRVSQDPLRPGMYVSEGQTLFYVNDLAEVWAEVSVSLQHLGHIYPQQRVKLISETNSGADITGTVMLTEKSFEQNTQKFLEVRIRIERVPSFLKLNSLVTALFGLRQDKRLTVPASAVFRTGRNAYVWVKTGQTESGTGIFTVRKVTCGTNEHGFITILNGIPADAEIALQAGLMTDSETFLSLE